MAHDCPTDGTPAFGLSCCYCHLKDRLRRGEHLSGEERDFVGAYQPRPARGGWHQPTALSAYALDEPTLSAEESELLHVLMAVGDSAERFEFLA